jgi:hypothetical protein
VAIQRGGCRHGNGESAYRLGAIRHGCSLAAINGGGWQRPARWPGGSVKRLAAQGGRRRGLPSSAGWRK